MATIGIDFDKTISKTDIGSDVQAILVAICSNKEMFDSLPENTKKQLQTIYDINPENLSDDDKKKINAWKEEVRKELKNDRGANNRDDRNKEMQSILDLLDDDSDGNKIKKSSVIKSYLISDAFARKTREDGGDEKLKKAVADFILSNQFQYPANYDGTNPEWDSNIAEALKVTLPPRNYLSGTIQEDALAQIKNLRSHKNGGFTKLLDPKIADIAKNNPNAAITSYNNNDALMAEILKSNDIAIPIIYGSITECQGAEYAGSRPLLKFIHALAIEEWKENNPNKTLSNQNINTLISSLPDDSFAKQYVNVIEQFGKNDKNINAQIKALDKSATDYKTKFANLQQQLKLNVSRDGYKSEISDLRRIYKAMYDEVCKNDEDRQKLSEIAENITLIDDHHKTILPFVFGEMIPDNDGKIQYTQNPDDIIIGHTIPQNADKSYAFPNVARPLYYTKAQGDVVSIHGHNHQITNEELEKWLEEKQRNEPIILSSLPPEEQPRFELNALRSIPASAPRFEPNAPNPKTPEKSPSNLLQNDEDKEPPLKKQKIEKEIGQDEYNFSS